MCKETYTVRGSLFAWLKVIFCRVFHRNRFIVVGLPSASRILRWPIRCRLCDSQYEIETPNTPQYISPFKIDLTRPKTWEEYDRSNQEIL